MARKSRTGVLKRQREAKKAEKAALKRERQTQRDTRESDGARVATSEDLAGYGFHGDSETEGEDSQPPAAAEGCVAGASRAAREEAGWPTSP